MKELEKTYDPSVIEDRIYQKWLDSKYFHASVNRDKKPFAICYAAAQYHRTASYGACPGQYHAGYPDPL